MLKKTLLLMGTVLASLLRAQDNTVSNGSEIVGSGGTVSQSVGQVFYTSVSGSSLQITQGMQQTYILVEETFIAEQTNLPIINVYPNPSSDFVVLELENDGINQYQFSLTDLNGKLLVKETSPLQKNTINLKAYANGTYHLTIYSNNQPLKSFKLIKTQ